MKDFEEESVDENGTKEMKEELNENINDIENRMNRLTNVAR